MLTGRWFDHPSAEKLHKVLKHVGYEIDKKIIDNLTKYCTHCWKHRKLLSHFKFTLKEDDNFNYSIFVDITYIDKNLILHIVNEATQFWAARWLKNVSKYEDIGLSGTKQKLMVDETEYLEDGLIYVE